MQPEMALRAQAAQPPGKPRRRRQRGSSLIELSLMAPWFLFLFVAVVDIGFFCNDVIAVENAARVAAEYTSGSSTTAAPKPTNVIWF